MAKLPHSRRRGAVAVEFAITASVAFLFFFAALEFSRVSMIHHTVENALYEGARHGITPGATVSEVEEAVTSMLRTIGVTNANISVEPSPILDSSQTISVSADVPLESNLYAPARFVQGLRIQRTLTLERELP